MNKNFTYNINEEALRQRLSDFELAFDEMSWSDLEKRLDESKVASPISIGKFNPKLLAIPAVILLGCAVLYLNIDKLRSENVPVTTSLQVSTPIVTAEPVQKEQPSEVKITAPADEPVKTLEKEASIPVVKQEVVKEDVKSEIPAETKIASTNEQLNTNTSSDPSTPKKKKKRRNRSADIYESVRNASMAQSDESVVVPGN
jgi:hypothetical protein